MFGDDTKYCSQNAIEELEELESRLTPAIEKYLENNQPVEVAKALVVVNKELYSARAEKHEPPDNYEIQVTSKDDRHEAESKSTKDTPQDSSSSENAENYYDSGKLADMTVTYPGELTPEEAEALVKEIEESGIVDDEKAELDENLHESFGDTEVGEDKLDLPIDHVTQPSEILDQLAKELDLISSNEVEGNPSDNKVLPELLDRVMTAEKVVKDTADSLEVIEPAETLEPLRQEEDAEI